jgi:sarcosine oxidase subunit alpha
VKRLPPVPGEWIDRERALSFSFEGKRYTGFAGDVISSALAANDVRVVGRSFKYHRARGLLSFANADVNAMVQAGARLNIRADVGPLEDGMQVRAVNTVGGLASDRGRFLDWLSPFLPVGFYYKAFHSKRWFPFWERVIRRASGLGAVEPNTPRARTAKRYDFCDVLVIGGGPAGLSAALAAANAGLGANALGAAVVGRAGREVSLAASAGASAANRLTNPAGPRVALIDENAHLGGSGLFNLGADESQRTRMADLVAQVEQHPRIKRYTSSFAAGYYADHWIPIVEPSRITKMRARAVVFATGALEQPAVFRNNDLPGVMLASAAQRLIYRYAIAPGTRAVVLAANSDAYRAARDLASHGMSIAAIVDLRAENELSTAPDSPVLLGHGVYEAVAKHGVLKAVRVAPIRIDGELDPTQCSEIECDLLLMSTGWAPAFQLLRQANVTFAFDSQLSQFVPAELPEGLFACGRVNGVHDFNDRCADGERAGFDAATHVLQVSEARPSSMQPAAEQPAAVQRSARLPTETPVVGNNERATLSTLATERSATHPLRRDSPSHPYPIFSHPRGKNFVDFDEDLQLKDFFNAAQEGFDNIELLKRFSTFGMGPSQGKHSNANTGRILAKIRGVSVGEAGTPTSRPMVHPVPMSHLAGRAFAVERRTPLHSRHAALNAKWMTAGAWQRPEYYERAGETRERSILGEALAVRECVGLIDVGTLGKIEAHGADAGALLDRAYTGRFSTLKPGTTRYGLMLDESGVIVDDGVIARLSDHHFYFTTTTSGSANVYRELQRNNLQWDLRATLVNLTGHLGAMNLAGPRAREVLAEVCDLDLSDESFPYLGARIGNVAGVPSRLMRVGFVGEVGYEIHAPARSIGKVWDALMIAGAKFGIRPFGVEAQRLLRLEKGHIIVGQDTDGLTSPTEIGADWALALDKPFFVGQRSLQALSKREQRQRLVGFRLDDPNGPRPLECHLVIANNDIAGRVTSIAWSPTLKSVIGLAFVTPNLTAPGTPLAIRITDGSLVKATVTPTPFYDAKNQRQKLAEAA